MVPQRAADAHSGCHTRGGHPHVERPEPSVPDPNPTLSTAAVAVDVALLTVSDGIFSILLVQPEARGTEGMWALPGGRVHDDENLDDAAQRFLTEHAGVEAPEAHLEQLRTYGEPERDPRARVVSVAYIALTPAPRLPDDPDRVDLFPIDHLGTSAGPDLAFDHDRIVPDAVERARAKLEYTPLATAFVAEPFTLADVRRVYEAVWGVPLDPGNFRRKILSTADFVVPTEQTAPPGPEGGRPARLYRRGTARLLHPAMLRPGREPTGS